MIAIPRKRYRATVCECGEDDPQCCRFEGDLDEAMQTLCAFLNGAGGVMVFGEGPDGRVIGAEVAERIEHEIKLATARFFPPPPPIEFDRIPIGSRGVVLMVFVRGYPNCPLFTYDRRPYERVRNTTRMMSKAKYKKCIRRRFKKWLTASYKANRGKPDPDS